MTIREEVIKNLIKEQGYNLKDFAAHIGIPYTTLLSMLRPGMLGGAATDSVFKICAALGISADSLAEKDISSQDLKYSTYYTNPETARLAQEAYDDPEVHILLDAKKDLKPEDLKLVIDMVKRMKNT